MVIHDLQEQLVEIVSVIWAHAGPTEGVMKQARKLLEQYVSAVRDYDYMAETAARSLDADEPDIFHISTDDLLGYSLMREKGMAPPSQYLRKPYDRELYGDGINLLPGMSRTARWRKVRAAMLIERMAMGLFGGFALIVPMLIMVLHKNLLTTLLTTSVATVLFAGALVLFARKLSGEQVLASVAAYAAVLVVFIGSSGTGT